MEIKVTRYNGRICLKHPEMDGLRRTCDNKCIQCERERGKRREAIRTANRIKKKPEERKRKYPQLLGLDAKTKAKVYHQIKKEEYKNSHRYLVDQAEKAKRIELRKQKRIEYENSPEYIEKKKIEREKRKEHLSFLRKNGYFKNKYKNLPEEKKIKRREYAIVYSKTERGKELRRLNEKERRIRRKNNINYCIRSRICRSINERLARYGKRKQPKTIEIIGCSIDELRQHLESLFVDGMSWGNRGEWHIDHIKPCAAFDLSNDEQLKECFNWRNLQPLWGTDNVRKGSLYLGVRHKHGSYTSIQEQAMAYTQAATANT